MKVIIFLIVILCVLHSQQAESQQKPEGEESKQKPEGEESKQKPEGEESKQKPEGEESNTTGKLDYLTGALCA
ncbi:unnamed protein product [Fasciola hepatica]|uniref:Uncharacterized protein n=1 Tax=Fasciola hepatica TaxID=6192 RepID=A0ABC9HH60_FASHE